MKKFRIWDRAGKEWVYITLVEAMEESNWDFDYNLDYDTISQYTGLKDKNGREVFEGDVIKYSNLYVDDAKTWEVDSRKGCFGLRYKSSFIPLYRIDPVFMEVIGNKFEHPHLLERRDDDGPTQQLNQAQ